MCYGDRGETAEARRDSTLGTRYDSLRGTVEARRHSTLGTRYDSLSGAAVSTEDVAILNDGTMITISHDTVIPEKYPQRWAMFEVTVISIILSLVACLSSLILLLMLLHCNAANPGGFVGAALGSSGRDYILFSEAQTMLYLKISLSDFLTLFAARTRTFFWERRPGYMLGGAAALAMGSSTLLALFWDDIFSSGDIYMAGLRRSSTAVVAIWVYCVLWFLAQDLAKVVTYKVLESLVADETRRHEDVSKRGAISNMYEATNRDARRRGLVSGTHGGGASLAPSDDARAPVSLREHEALEARVNAMAAEIAALREALGRRA